MPLSPSSGVETTAESVVQEVAHGALAKTHEAFRRSLGREPEWLTQLRDDGWRVFREHGIPSTRLEPFRKTSLKHLAKEPFRLPLHGGLRIEKEDLKPFTFPGLAGEYVLVDGRFEGQHSTLKGLPAGVRITPLAATIRDAPDRLKAHLGQVAPRAGPEDALNALAAAMMLDGVVVEVAKNVRVEAPVHILHVRTDETPPGFTAPRVLVNLAEGASITVIESHVGVTEKPHWTHAVTEGVVGPNAHLRHVRVQREGANTTHTGVVAFKVARDASVRTFSHAEGALVSRLDMRVALQGENASARLDGVFLVAGKQMMDHHTFIDHAVPRTSAQELVKGVAAGEGHGVFYGGVLVRKDAQQTSSSQENRNILLSRKAVVDSTPMLEIHADDVKCSHGSTVGRIPADQVYYLRSRGITDAEARRLLTTAFAGEALAHVGPESVRKALSGLVGAWFETHGGGA